MKFKYLIIALNIIVVFTLFMLFMMREFFTLGGFSPAFRLITFPLLVSMLFVLLGLEIYFFLNYRLFSLLEREDWPALAYYLEQLLYTKGRYNAKRVRLLATSYLLMSDYVQITKLENKASLAMPSCITKNVLIFGSARILNKNYKEAAGFFKTQLDKDKISSGDREWARCFHAYSHLLNGTFNEAEPELMSLAGFSRDAFVTGLSAYFLHHIIAKGSFNRADCLNAAEKGKERVKKIYKSADRWQKAIEKKSSDVHIAVIKKYIDEAGAWVYEADV